MRAAPRAGAAEAAGPRRGELTAKPEAASAGAGGAKAAGGRALCGGQWTLLKVSETPGAVPSVRGQRPVRWKTRGQCPNLGETGGNAQSFPWMREKHCSRLSGSSAVLSVWGTHKNFQNPNCSVDSVGDAKE